MRITVNRFTAWVLIVLLYPLVLVNNAVRWLSGHRKPV